MAVPAAAGQPAKREAAETRASAVARGGPPSRTGSGADAGERQHRGGADRQRRGASEPDIGHAARDAVSGSAFHQAAAGGGSALRHARDDLQYRYRRRSANRKTY